MPVSTVLRSHRTVSLLLTVETGDRKSTRLNSSHTVISYAVFCLKKKKFSEILLDAVDGNLGHPCGAAHRYPAAEDPARDAMNDGSSAGVLLHARASICDAVRASV